ncbi:MAG: hypothetical protein K2J39_02090 [Ruminococcus sp.]|nr:hypothetical protein [Ruminococcus sp.]
MIDKELKKLNRHEKYLKEKDSSHGVLRYGTEEELYSMNPSGIMDTEKEEQEFQYKMLMYKAMNMAMHDLHKLNPYWYQLVKEFYLCTRQITLAQLGEMHGKSRQAVSKSLKRAMSVLRQIAEEYLEKFFRVR